MFNITESLPLNTTYIIAQSNNGYTIAIGTHIKAYIYNYDHLNKSWILLGNVIEIPNIQSIALATYNNNSILVCGLINSVRVYRLNNNQWVQITALSGESVNENFGVKVAISTDSQYILCSETLTGYIKIYKYSASQITFQLIQKISDNPGFGSSIDISNNGNTFIMGNSTYDANRGQLRIYSYISNSYQLNKLINGIEINDLLGKNVSISGDGNTISFNTFGKNTVSVFRYDNATTNWLQLGNNLYNQNIPSFGSSLVLAKNSSIIAISATNFLHNRGLIQLFNFNYNTNQWSQLGNTVFGKTNNTFTGKELKLSDDGKILIFTTSSTTDLTKQPPPFVNASISAYSFKLPDAKTLYASGYTILELQKNGYTIQEIFTAGYSITQLKIAGYTITQFLANGFTLTNLKPFYTIRELKDGGITNAQILPLGYNSLDLYNNDIPFNEIKTSYGLIRMKNEGITIDIFIDNDITIRQLYDIGFTISQIYSTNKYSYFDILEAGFIEELEELSFIYFKNDISKSEPYDYYIFINNNNFENTIYLYINRSNPAQNIINFDTISFSTINLYDKPIDTSEFKIVKTSAINMQMNTFKQLFISNLSFYSHGFHLLNIILQKYIKPVILNKFIEVFEDKNNISFDDIPFDNKINFFKEFSKISLSYFRKKITRLNNTQLNDIIYSYEIHSNKIYLSNELIIYSEALQVGVKIIFDFIVYI